MLPYSIPDFHTAAKPNQKPAMEAAPPAKEDMGKAGGVDCIPIRDALERLLGVIEAHECTCFSCDRDGEAYCECLHQEAKRARSVLYPNNP